MRRVPPRPTGTEALQAARERVIEAARKWRLSRQKDDDEDGDIARCLFQAVEALEIERRIMEIEK